MRGAILGGMLVTLLSGIDMSSIAVLDADARWAEAAPAPPSVRPQRVVRTMSLPGVTFTYILYATRTSTWEPVGNRGERATLNSTL